MRQRQLQNMHGRSRSMRVVGGSTLFALAIAMKAGIANPAVAAEIQAGDGAAAGAKCASLAQLSLPGARVTSAVAHLDGQLIITRPDSPEGMGEAPAKIRGLPPFCQIAADVGKETKFEVWLPIGDKWNGKFYMQGVGGFGGLIYSQPGYAPSVQTTITEALRKGYAVASSNLGHTAGGIGDGNWYTPERLLSWSQTSIHEPTVRAKQLINAFYGSFPKHSYFHGCSGGGRQGVVEATMYPEDFDGIIAVSPPVPDIIPTQVWMQRVQTAAFKEPGRSLSLAQIRMLQRAVLAKCDKIDGLQDGQIDDPRACKFDPSEVQCGKSVARAECLTEKQVATVRTIYSYVRDLQGNVVHYGVPPGYDFTEESRLLGSWVQPAFALSRNFFSYWVYKDPKWDYRKFDTPEAERAGMELAIREVGPLMTTTADMRAFRDRGGKIVLMHGWEDSGMPALNSIQYYKNVVETATGAKFRGDFPAETTSFIRLFMVPGQQHCSGGSGPREFDALSVIDAWVENGSVPDKIVLARRAGGQNQQGLDGNIDRTRPVCPYPQAAIYNGQGSIDDEKNFRCGVRPQRK